MFELEDITIFGISGGFDVFEQIWIKHVGCEWIFCLGVVLLSAILLRGHFEVRRRNLLDIDVIFFRFFLVELTTVLLILLHHHATALLQHSISFC